jgi:opacity protein-like surface antigen
VDTGWNNFEDPNGKMGFYGGFNWTSKDEKTTVNFILSLSNEQPTGVQSTRTHYCLCGTRKLSDKWTAGFETDFGVDSFSKAAGTDAEWGSIIPYLTYKINDCWWAGLRYEWLRDNQGVIIAPPSDPFFPAPGDWNDLSLGLNYKPNKNVIVRSEIRYDWESSLVPVPANQRPFDDNTKGFQWTWGTDLIMKF